MSDAAQNSTTGAGAGSTASDAAAGQSTAAAQRTRAPLDPEKRAAAAQRAVVRKLTARVSGAKSEAEFWQLAEGLAKKQGKALAVTKVDAAPTAPPDPLDERVGPQWPTKREVQAATPTAKVLLSQLATRAKGTRYEEAATTAQLSCEEPLAACVAKYASDMKDMSPGAALALTAAFTFGPLLAAHGVELARAWLDEREKAAALPSSTAPETKPDAKKKAAA